jgi:hypothetical protein
LQPSISFYILVNLFLYSRQSLSIFSSISFYILVFRIGGAIGLAVGIALHVWTLKNRESPAVQTSGELYCHTVLVGTDFSFVFMILFGTVDESHNAICQMTTTAFIVSYAILVPALYTRFWVLRHKDYLEKRLMRMDTLTLAVPVMTSLLYYLTVWALLMTVDPPTTR